MALQEGTSINRPTDLPAQAVTGHVQNNPDHAAANRSAGGPRPQAKIDPNTHGRADDSNIVRGLQDALARACAEALDQRHKHNNSSKKQLQSAAHAKALAVQVSELQSTLAAAQTKAAEAARADRVLVSQYQSEAAAAKREACALREASVNANRMLEKRTAAVDKLVLERDRAAQHLVEAHADAGSLRLLLKEQHAAMAMMMKQAQAKKQGSAGKAGSLAIDAMAPKGVPLLFARDAGDGSNAACMIGSEPGRNQKEADLQAKLKAMGKEHQRVLSQLHAAEARAESAADAARAETRKRRDLASEVQKLKSQLEKLEAQALRWEQVGG